MSKLQRMISVSDEELSSRGLLTFAEYIECEHSEAFQQWQKWQWLTTAGADFSERDVQALVHDWQECTAAGEDCVEKYVL